MKLQSLVLQLFEIGAVRFGAFTLKSGISSPIYLDLRLTVSYPKLLIDISAALHEAMRPLHFDLLCGVPYTALPFATAISIQHNIPMVMRRKEKKEYGTGKTIEGVFSAQQRCLILEDVITSGESVLETATHLRQAGLVIEDAVVLIDREQGGVHRLANAGLRAHCVLTLSYILQILLAHRKIEPSLAEAVKTFLADHQVC